MITQAVLVAQETASGMHPVWAIPGAAITALAIVLPAWWAHRRAMRGINVVAESVGPVNGHGTVQDATGLQLAQGDEILAQLAAVRADQQAMHRTQHAMQTSLDAVVDAASVVGQRLKAHDREIADLRRRGDD